jgi:putative acetyltransferase
MKIMPEEQIIIREVSEADNAALAKVIRAAFDEYGVPKQGTVYSDATTDDLFSLFRQPKSVLWVAASGGHAVGCCGIYPTDGLPRRHAELVKFYLSKEARGKGVGKMLMMRCIASAGQLGYQYLYLESFPQFEQAIGMYEKQGFTKINHPMGNSGHCACTVWMLKEVKDRK